MPISASSPTLRTSEGPLVFVSLPVPLVALMRPYPMLRTVHYRVLAVLWTAGLLLSVTVPTGTMPEVQSAFGLDKIVHAVLFAGFGLLWLRGLCPPNRNSGASVASTRGLLVLVAGVVFAVGTEVYQYLAPIERMAGFYDATADLIGLLGAFGTYSLYLHYSESSSK